MSKTLVIDDDQVNRKLLTKSLEGMGQVCVQSANGRHGWETLVENDDIDLIITDMMMPDMDGRELVHLIRANDAYKDIPVIIVSGALNKQDIQPIIDISPTNTFFLSKPIDQKAIKKYLSVINQSKGEGCGDCASN